MIKYRKIYEQYYGPIPKDKDGRSYEIHHIDGDHENDSPDNLKAVTIQEHYDIHHSRCDWYACIRIAERMKLYPEEISNLAKRNVQKQLDDGIHPFQTRLDGTSLSSDRVADGTHPFLGGEVARKTSRRRVKDGTHNLLDGEMQRRVAQQRVLNGTHPFLGPTLNQRNNKIRIENGTHHFITDHPNKNMPKITCPHCLKTGGRNNMKRYHFDNCKFKSL